MVNYPEVQARAQEELASAVGDPRILPSLDHKDELNFVQSIVYEVLRHANVVPFSGKSMKSMKTILCFHN